MHYEIQKMYGRFFKYHDYGPEELLFSYVYSEHSGEIQSQGNYFI